MFIKTRLGAIEDDRSNVSCGVSLGYKVVCHLGTKSKNTRTVVT